jgi:hypothetical protein
LPSFFDSYFCIEGRRASLLLDWNILYESSKHTATGLEDYRTREQIPINFIFRAHISELYQQASGPSGNLSRRYGRKMESPAKKKSSPVSKRPLWVPLDQFLRVGIPQQRTTRHIKDTNSQRGDSIVVPFMRYVRNRS